jgi:hypothetical protein
MGWLGGFGRGCDGDRLHRSTLTLVPGLDLDIRVPESNPDVRLDHKGGGWVQQKQRLVLPTLQAQGTA